MALNIHLKSQIMLQYIMKSFGKSIRVLLTTAKTEHARSSKGEIPAPRWIAR